MFLRILSENDYVIHTDHTASFGLDLTDLLTVKSCIGQKVPK